MRTQLFEPYTIGKLQLKNRFVRSATYDVSADESGAVTDTSVAMYRELGKGGVGLVVGGYAFVSANGQSWPGQYGVHTDAMIPGLRRMVRAAHDGGAKIALQIAHAGTYTPYLGKKGIPALAVSKLEGAQAPQREMTNEDIESIVVDFGAAARRAKEAGFDAVQFHATHGYLGSQFLSPLSNRRQDRWGGSLENRRRFHLAVVDEIRKVMGPNYPVMIKLGVEDDAQGGLSIDEGVKAAREIAKHGTDAIEVSTGSGDINIFSQVKAKGAPEDAYFRARAKAVKQAVSVPVMAVGGIRSLKTAEDIVASGDADLISM
jgi:2,4-dienoyl-CoA reductase-like NADH-dependent reductase (Old Yellow Enzyme family)